MYTVWIAERKPGEQVMDGDFLLVRMTQPVTCANALEISEFFVSGAVPTVVMVGMYELSMN